MKKSMIFRNPRRLNSPWRIALCSVPVMLASACSTSWPPTSSASVAPPQIPTLPANARQIQPTPSICLPSCSDALTQERESWRLLLMKPE